MNYKRALIPVAAVALVCGGIVAAYAATTSTQVTCPQHPAASGGQYSFVCTTTHPKSTETFHGVVPQPTPTPSPSASPSSSPTPTFSATPTPTMSPTPTLSATPTATSTPPPAGFPDASNTGPTGTLTAYTGPCAITTTGTVIDSKLVKCDLQIQAANVTIRNSEIDGTVATDENSTGYSFTITDSLVNAGNQAGTGVGAVHFTMLRTEVTGGNRSVNCWIDCTVRDSYVHGQFKDASGVTHESGIRMGDTNTIVHNSIGCDAPNIPPDAGCSADLTGYGDFAPVANVLVQGNLFLTSTGGFCAYGGSSAGKPYSADAHDIRFTGNRWQRGSVDDHGHPDCADYGPITDFDPSRPGNAWSDNAYVDGTVITP